MTSLAGLSPATDTHNPDRSFLTALTQPDRRMSMFQTQSVCLCESDAGARSVVRTRSLLRTEKKVTKF